MQLQLLAYLRSWGLFFAVLGLNAQSDNLSIEHSPLGSYTFPTRKPRYIKIGVSAGIFMSFTISDLHRLEYLPVSCAKQRVHVNSMSSNPGVYCAGRM